MTENIEVQPYQETLIGSRPPLTVSHQGDEEQHVLVYDNGAVQLNGPHDWTVTATRTPQVDALHAALRRAKELMEGSGPCPLPSVTVLLRAVEDVLPLLPPARPQD